MIKKYNKLTKILGATVVASSLLFPSSAQAAIDASNISVDTAMENDIVAKINAIRMFNGLPPVIYSSNLSEKSRVLLAGADSVESRFTNGANSAHHYNGAVDFNTNEVWGANVSSDFAASQWLTEIGNVTTQYPIGHCKALLSASAIGGALATENGRSLYVSSYIDGSSEVAAKAQEVCLNPNLNKNLEGYYAMLNGDKVKSSTPSADEPVKQPIQAQEVSIDTPTSVVETQPEVAMTEVKVEAKPEVATTEAKVEAKPEVVTTETEVEAKPEVVTTETKVEAKPEVVTTEAKVEAKPEVATTEAKVEAKPEVATTETKVEAKSQVVTIATSKKEDKSSVVGVTQDNTEKQEQHQLINDLTKQAIDEDITYINQVVTSLKALPLTSEITDLINQIEKAKNEALAMKDDTKVLEGLENIIIAFEKMANEQSTETVSTVAEVKEIKTKQEVTTTKPAVKRMSAKTSVEKVAKSSNKKMTLPNTGVAQDTQYAQIGLVGLLLLALGFGLRKKVK